MIYSAPSIYKQGGGGGGYSDGGELVDGDLIKVDNNTTSNYNNDSRNEINLYIEASQTEYLDSVVNVFTSLNCTVNVYIREGDLFTSLGYINTNVLTANKYYIIFIKGKTFDVEEVNDLTTEPNKALINNKFLKIVKIGNVTWTAEDVFTYSLSNAAKTFVNGTSGKWKVPDITQFTTAAAILGSNSLLFAALNITMTGYATGGGTIINDGTQKWVWTSLDQGERCRLFSDYTISGSGSAGGNQCALILVDRYY